MHRARCVAVAHAVIPAAIETKQAADIVVAAGHAAGVAVDDGAALVVADQAARIVLDGGGVAGGVTAAHRGDDAIVAIIVTDQAAYIASSAGVTGGITAGDGAIVVLAHQATHALFRADDRSAGITASDGAIVVLAHQAAHAVFRADDRSAGVAAADGAMVHFTDEAADPAAAADIAAGVAVFDGALVGQADQAADALVTANRPGGVAVADQAGIRPYQATNFVVAADRPGGVAIADQAGIRAYQAANIVLSANAAAEHADMANDGTCLRVADQSYIPGIGQVDIQAADGMPLAVQATGECVVARADGNEASFAPDSLAARRAAGIDVCTQHIRGARRHGHQLQLVRIVDRRRVFGRAHRIGGARRSIGIVQAAVHVDQHPVVARCARRGGEVKARETAGRAHLRVRQAGAALGGGLARTVDGPETVDGFLRCAIAADQTAEVAAAVGDEQAPHCVAGIDRSRVGANQAANLALARHAARGIAVADRSQVAADQAPAPGIAADGARGVAVDDGAAVVCHQAAADEAIGGDIERRIAVFDRALVVAHQAASVIVRLDVAAIQTHVLDQGILGGNGKQAAAAAVSRHHAELIDGMTEAIEDAAKGRIPAQRHEARIPPIGVPGGRGGGGGVDICAQHIIAIQLAINALQVGARDTAVGAQGGNHRVAGAYAVRAQFGAEILSSGQIYLGAAAQLVHGCVAGGGGALAVFQRQAGRAGTVQGGIDVDVALRVQGQLMGGPADLVVDVYVAGRPGAASRALDHDIAIAQVGRQGGAADVAAAGGDGEVDRVDQPGAGAALGSGRADAHVVGDLHVGGARFDEATIAAIRGAGVQRAAHMGGAGCHAAKQDDAAIALFHAARLDDARVVDDAGQQGIAGASAHQHLAAIGADQPAVLGQVVQGALVDLQLQQARAVKAQGGGAAGAQGNRAQACRNAALVAHLPAQQGDIAAIGRAQRAFIDDLARAIAAERVLRAAQAGVVDVERRGDQAAHIDLCAAAEQHAVRVDQVHLAVRVDAPQDLRAVVVEDAVDCQRAGRGLDEVDGFIGADVETVPVQRRLLARLPDGGAVALLADAGRACHHLPARGSGQRRSSQRQRRHGGGRGGQFAAAALAAPARRFRNGDPGVQDVAPDEAIDVIQ